MTIDEAIFHEERNVEINKLIGEVSDCEPTNAIAYHRQLIEWMNELKQLREQTRWIPVSERLPEEGEEVLVSGYDTYNKKVIIARYQGERYGFTCGLVSAWMPLPEPYKLESEDKE